MTGAMESIGGVESYEDEIWKMIAFASRYGHQPLVAIVGDVTVDRVNRFCGALQHWLRAERKNGSDVYNSMAEGGG